MNDIWLIALGLLTFVILVLLLLRKSEPIKAWFKTGPFELGVEKGERSKSRAEEQRRGSEQISREARDILITTLESKTQEIFLISTDQAGSFVRVGREVNYFFENDKYKTKRYIEALEELQGYGLVKHEGGVRYGLTSEGEEKARKLYARGNKNYEDMNWRELTAVARKRRLDPRLSTFKGEEGAWERDRVEIIRQLNILDQQGNRNSESD